MAAQTQRSSLTVTMVSCCDNVPPRIIRITVLYKLAFRGYSKSDFKLPKLHALLHLCHFIRLYGALLYGAGYPYEMKIREGLRQPYNVVSRRLSGLQQRLAADLALRAAVSRGLSVYDDEEVRGQLYYDVEVGRKARSKQPVAAAARQRVHRGHDGGVTFSVWEADDQGFTCEITVEGSAFSITDLPAPAQHAVRTEFVRLPDACAATGPSIILD